MRLLIINPNTSDKVTRAVEAAARRYAHPETQLTIVQASAGPETIRCRYEELLSVPANLSLLAEHSAHHDGVLFACYGDHPILYAARELISKPVVGIAEASMHMACFLGHRFSIITTNAAWIPLLSDAAQRYGLAGRCASIRALGLSGGEILQLSQSEIQEQIAQQAEQALQQDGAEVICLGGAALTGFDQALSERLQVPVLDGVVCGLKVLEGLVGYGLSTSKWRAYGSLNKSLAGGPAHSLG
ncbi:MAG: aspartate/glutamate racemase family protein [Thermostichus sp. BF3_bins_97]